MPAHETRGAGIVHGGTPTSVKSIITLSHPDLHLGNVGVRMSSQPANQDSDEVTQELGLYDITVLLPAVPNTVVTSLRCFSLRSREML